MLLALGGTRLLMRPFAVDYRLKQKHWQDNSTNCIALKKLSPTIMVNVTRARKKINGAKQTAHIAGQRDIVTPCNIFTVVRNDEGPDVY